MSRVRCLLDLFRNHCLLDHFRIRYPVDPFRIRYSLDLFQDCCLLDLFRNCCPFHCWDNFSAMEVHCLPAKVHLRIPKQIGSNSSARATNVRNTKSYPKLSKWENAWWLLTTTNHLMPKINRKCNLYYFTYLERDQFQYLISWFGVFFNMIEK